MGNWAIPLGALILSAAALAYSTLNFKRTGKSSFEQAMSDRITQLTAELQQVRADYLECGRRCKRLEDENYKLMRRLMRLENGE